jgi:Uma2 family endonuclease
MSSAALRKQPQLSLAEFSAFRDARPNEEKWELIDGVPMMMPLPTIIHQIIARNLVRHLTDVLDRVNPSWLATHEVGVELPGGILYHPEPDVVVIDADVAPGQRYADKFYAVAEVLSESDNPEPIAAKVAFYQSHPANTCILLIGQDLLSVEILERGADSGWVRHRLDRAEQVLHLAAIGDVCTLAQLYRGTPAVR